MLEALRVRDFRLLWFARLISLLGSWLLVVAVPAQVYRLTGSLALTGLTLAAEMVPPMLLGPVAGVLADRWDRRHVMVAADLLRAVAVAMLVLAREPGDVWLVYLALVAESMGTVLFRPAAQAHTPVVVGTGPMLTSANSLNALADGAVRLIGPPLGGALLALAGFELLIWLDTATYLVSAAAILLTARVAGPPIRSGGWADLRAGLAFVRRDRIVRALLLVNTLFLGANAALSALLVPHGVTVWGGSGETGVALSGLGAGFLIGAPVFRALADRLAPAHLLGAALTVIGLCFAVLFAVTSLTAALPPIVLLGVAGSTALGAVQLTLQRATPNDVLGRASAAMFTLEAAATLAGALLGPAVAEASSIPWTAVAAGVLTVASGILAWVLLPRAVGHRSAG